MSENEEITEDLTDTGAVEYGSKRGTDFDEIERRNSLPTPTDFSKITLDDDDVPASLRGKTVADAIAHAKALQNALEISENARLALKNSSEALAEVRSGQQSQQNLPVPAAPHRKSPEEWRELFDTDPFEYQQQKLAELKDEMLGTMQSAIAPIAGSASEFSQRDAQSRFPDEYAALGKEINETVARIQDKSALVNPGAMDELISYVRGKHVTKYIEYLNRKNGQDLSSARVEASRQTPNDFATTPQRRTRSPSKQLDETEKEIARALGVTYDDFLKNK